MVIPHVTIYRTCLLVLMLPIKRWLAVITHVTISCRRHNDVFVYSGFCDCAVREEPRQELRAIQLEYARLLEELVESGRYDTRDDFTVVLQPHMRDLVPLDVSSNTVLVRTCTCTCTVHILSPTRQLNANQ